MKPRFLRWTSKKAILFQCPSLLLWITPARYVAAINTDSTFDSTAGRHSQRRSRRSHISPRAGKCPGSKGSAQSSFLQTESKNSSECLSCSTVQKRRSQTLLVKCSMTGASLNVWCLCHSIRSLSGGLHSAGTKAWGTPV